MRIDVPFYKAEKETDCGSLALKMVLSYFGEDYSSSKLLSLMGAAKTGFVWSLGVLKAAKELGYPVEFYSTSNFNPADLDFYQEHADNESYKILKELKDRLEVLDVNIQETDISLDKLLEYISENSIPIVLLNWYVIAKKEGFHGHFVPLTGFDEENVYIHNMGLARAMPYFPVKRDIFLKAWESKGTDKDTIIIYRKN